MKKIILLNKKEGETPLEALEVFRSRNKEYKDVKITYAGRLDPLASGLLILLAGDITKEKEKYTKLSKEYEFKILFGFTTDTHDILGKVTHSNVLTNIRIKEIKENIKFFRGKFKQKYPLYSSKTLKKARAGKKIKAPEHMVEIKSFEFLTLETISSLRLLNNIEKRIAKVRGDFRQKEILKIWRKVLLGHRMFKSQFYVGKFYVKCSSGMYVRQLSHDLGQRIGVPALAFKIKRTNIGKWSTA